MALHNHEFFAVIDALESRSLSVNGSGFREIHGVFSQLESKASQNYQTMFALENRRIYKQNNCEIWSLSPDDSSIKKFLKSVGSLLPNRKKVKKRTQSILPNEAAVVLWVKIDEILVLLGSDLEKRGWMKILQNTVRPTGKASIFKVPHHGSKNAQVPDVWNQMMRPEPFAILTPWKRGNRFLPTQEDIKWIISKTKNAYITANPDSINKSPPSRKSNISRTIRESNISLRQHVMSSGMIRLRKSIDLRENWKIEIFESAYHLS